MSKYKTRKNPVDVINYLILLLEIGFGHFEIIHLPHGVSVLLSAR